VVTSFSNLKDRNGLLRCKTSHFGCGTIAVFAMQLHATVST